PTDRPRISSGVDIIANAKRTVRLVDGEVYFDVAGGVLAGTWDTVIEREFADSKAAGSGMLDNAMMPTRPTEGSLRRPGAALGATVAARPEHAVTAVRRERANGYSVLVPASEPLSGEGQPKVWSHWRVGPETGEALGMNSEGRGASRAEFIIGL